MNSIPQHPPDHYQYHGLSFTSDEIRFLAKASRYYADQMDKDLQAIQGNELIIDLLGDNLQQTTQPLVDEIERFRRGADRLEARINDAELFGIPMMHRTVRELKSIGRLYLQELRASRDSFVRQGVSARALEIIDSRLALYSEAIEGGIFARAEPVPLLVEFNEAQHISIPGSPEPVLSRVSNSSPPSPIFGIEILDPELRARCLPLLQLLSANLAGEEIDAEQRAEQFDTIVREAVSIVEHRIRMTIGADASRSGLDLVSDAFGRNPAHIQISSDENEHLVAHSLFRGFFGFIRNPFSHRLISITRGRAIQILALADYLLYLLASSGKVPSTTT